MTTSTIRVSDFTVIPGPRFRNMGDGSAEQFYEEFVLPVLKKEKPKYLILDCGGTWGYGPSFVSQLTIYLSEWFKGLDKLKQVLTVVAEGNPQVIDQFGYELNGGDKKRK